MNQNTSIPHLSTTFTLHLIALAMDAGAAALNGESRGLGTMGFLLLPTGVIPVDGLASHPSNEHAAGDSLRVGDLDLAAAKAGMPFDRRDGPQGAGEQSSVDVGFHQLHRMRDPRPGSVRASVYEVLADGRIHRRGEIIRTVAQRRGVKVDEQLEGVVGSVLENRCDRGIERVRRGRYRRPPKAWQRGVST